MAKNRGKLNEKKIGKWEKEGRGKGVLNDYIPWIITQDFASHGLNTRSFGWKTNRIHHFFSNLELYYFYTLEWCDGVTDIREQFPLNREDTVAIANKKGINHPENKVDRMPITMTTDFLITVGNGEGKKEFARTIKPSNKLEDRRVIEKFEIERVYWEQRNIDWGIVTDMEISQPLAMNMEWLHNSYYQDKTFSDSVFHSYKKKMKEAVNNSRVSIVETTDAFDSEFNLENGTGLSLLKYLIVHKEILVDITIPIHTHLKASNVLKVLDTTKED